MKKLIIFLGLTSLISYNKIDSAYIGPQVIYKNYFETLPNELKSEEKGFLYGFRGGLTYSLSKHVDFDLFTELAQGKTDYDGTRQSLITKKITPIKALTDNNLFNLEGDIGFPINYKRISLKPLWGLGYHLWERKLEDYLETYTWAYFSFGGILSVKALSFWDIGLEAKGFQTKFANIGIKDIYPWKQEISLDDHLQYSLKLINKFHFKYLNFYLSEFYQVLKIGPGENIKKSSLSAPLSTDKLLGTEFILEYNF